MQSAIKQYNTHTLDYIYIYTYKLYTTKLQSFGFESFFLENSQSIFMYQSVDFKHDIRSPVLSQRVPITALGPLNFECSLTASRRRRRYGVDVTQKHKLGLTNVRRFGQKRLLNALNVNVA